MARTSCIRFVLDQYAVGFLYSASSLKQQSAARHGHIILLPSQQVFNSLMWMDAEKQQIPILKSLIWPDRSLNPRSTAIAASTQAITPAMWSLLGEVIVIGQR
jgi:hypothetical protein